MTRARILPLPTRRVMLRALGGAACARLASPAAAIGVASPDRDSRLVWQSRFEQGLADWGPLVDRWGGENLAFLADPAVAGRAMRLQLRRGSIDPGTMRRRGLSPSGAGFKAAVIAGGASAATLHYRLRFAPGFDFVRGGKLPGLYGGRGHSGGRMPNGHDGFSLRLMWREAGAGEVYAYLPGLEGGPAHGRSLLRGQVRFEPGRWHAVRQQVQLNTPGHHDGWVRLTVDEQPAAQATGLRLRDTDRLRIDGVFVDVFFGGADDSWAARADTYVDLADFSVRVDPAAPDHQR